MQIQSHKAAAAAKFLSLSRHVDGSYEGALKNSTKRALSLARPLPFSAHLACTLHSALSVAPGPSCGSDAAAAATNRASNHYNDTHTRSHTDTSASSRPFLSGLFAVFVASFRMPQNVFSNPNCRALETDAQRLSNGQLPTEHIPATFAKTVDCF